MSTIRIDLWLHRDQGDAWLMSRSGVGQGTYVPKSAVVLEEGHPVPTLMPVGPIRCEIDRGFGELKGLVEVKDERQGEMFG